MMPVCLSEIMRMRTSIYAAAVFVNVVVVVVLHAPSLQKVRSKVVYMRSNYSTFYMNLT